MTFSEGLILLLICFIVLFVAYIAYDAWQGQVQIDRANQDLLRDKTAAGFVNEFYAKTLK